MNAIQLEFNLEDKTNEESKCYYLQVQINTVVQSLDKTRRNLFAQLSELKKTNLQLLDEIARLKRTNFSENPNSWLYLDGDCLIKEKI